MEAAYPLDVSPLKIVLHHPGHNPVASMLLACSFRGTTFTLVRTPDAGYQA